MRHAECANLAIRCPVAVEQEKIDDPVAAARQRKAFLARNGHASHQEAAGKSFFQQADLPRREQFGSRAQVHDRWPELPTPFLDQGNVRREKQCRALRGRPTAGRCYRCVGNRELPRELSVANQDADMIDSPGHRRRSPAPGSHRTWRADFPHQRSSAVVSQHFAAICSSFVSMVS
jgi:hypothetical protein